MPRLPGPGTTSALTSPCCSRTWNTMMEPPWAPRTRQSMGSPPCPRMGCFARLSLPLPTLEDPISSPHLSRLQLQPPSWGPTETTNSTTLKLSSSSYPTPPHTPPAQVESFRLCNCHLGFSTKYSVCLLFLLAHTLDHRIMRTRTFSYLLSQQSASIRFTECVDWTTPGTLPLPLKRPPFTHFLSISTFICFIFTKQLSNQKL